MALNPSRTVRLAVVAFRFGGRAAMLKMRSIVLLIGVICFCLSMTAQATAQASEILYANITLAGGNPRGLATIDTNTGLVTRIGPVFDTSNTMEGITYVSSMNALFGIAGPIVGGPSNLFRIDIGTGVQTFVGSTGANSVFIVLGPVIC